MTGIDRGRKRANDAIEEHRTRMVRDEMEKLVACLDSADLDCLRRAELGLPVVVLEWNQHPDGSGERSLAAIEKFATRLAGHQSLEALERIIEKLFGRYEAEPPDRYHWPDLRLDLNLLQSNIRDLREALNAGQVDNAIGRAIAVGAAMGRIGYWLLAGGDAASGATRVFAGRKGGITAKAKRETPRKREAVALAREKLASGKLSKEQVAVLVHQDKELWAPRDGDEVIRKPKLPTVRDWLKNI